MSSAIPTLTIDGFVVNKAIQVGKLFEYFLTSDYSQTNTYYSKIASMKYILAEYSNVSDIKSEIEKVLLRMYNTYYDSATVYIESTDPDIVTGIITLTISVICTYDNIQYQLSKNLKYVNSNITNYYDLLDELYEEYNR